MEKFLFIPVDGPMQVVEADASNRVSFFCQVEEMLECDWLEFVRCGEDFLIVDEVGKFCEPPKAVNKRASCLYPGSDFGDFIHGNVLIGAHGMRDGEPDFVGLRPSQLQILRNFFLAIGEVQ